MMFNLLVFLIEPKSQNLDERRREFILNVLLIGSIILACVALITNTSAYLYYQVKEIKFNGIKPLALFEFILVFIFLYTLSKNNHQKLSSYLFISIYFFAGIITSLIWGADVPQALLIYALVIVMSGILISTKLSLVVTFLISISLFTLSYFQSQEILEYNNYWLSNKPELTEAIIVSVTLSIITLISWLSNREIEKSLHRARTSEAALKKERDMLEVRVVQRTKELQKAQLDKMIHLYRFADFGRLASGLLNDLVSPLTTVALNLDHLQSKSKKLQVKNLGDLQEDIIKAIRGTERIESYVQAAQKQIKQQESNKTFSINEEIKQTLSLYTYRARKEGVKISLYFKKNIKTYGNPIKFNQLMSNLISNAFDSYDGTEKNSARSINISILRIKNNIVIKIQDHGKGIKKSDIAHIFDPFFTTKQADKGTGIGLSISKDIVTKNFNGTIRVKSEKEKGTEFIITFPIKHEPSH